MADASKNLDTKAVLMVGYAGAAAAFLATRHPQPVLGAPVLGRVSAVDMRIDQAVRESLPVFHEFFRTHLLPIQLRHGARLVGRWKTEDGRASPSGSTTTRPHTSISRRPYARIPTPGVPKTAAPNCRRS
jgi:hypothetical protein